MLVASGVYFGMLVLTLVALLLYNGWPKSYEELCTCIGGSVLWFITLPCAAVHHASNYRWRTSQEKKSEAWEEL